VSLCVRAPHDLDLDCIVSLDILSETVLLGTQLVTLAAVNLERDTSAVHVVAMPTTLTTVQLQT
jgi:hypothetical protein